MELGFSCTPWLIRFDYCYISSIGRAVLTGAEKAVGLYSQSGATVFGDEETADFATTQLSQPELTRAAGDPLPLIQHVCQRGKPSHCRKRYASIRR
ncbi:hypothetical protein J6590_064721 [Homalodisca vitripennis]|nr:hypothetical protein J6590_064721 [Homalodisca vitripennis]